MKATEKDIQHLDSLYEGRRAFHGDLHNHAATGGTSDGSRSLEHWKGGLEALGRLIAPHQLGEGGQDLLGRGDVGFHMTPPFKMGIEKALPRCREAPDLHQVVMICTP